MLILNQDKEDLVILGNMTNITVRLVNEDCEVIAYSAFWLGKYPTKDRAKEVLREIANAYSDASVTSWAKVYEMPEE
jgi:regulatory protein YycI of two-component signal transduction system YycFG